jgi:hypothetical protein
MGMVPATMSCGNASRFLFLLAHASTRLIKYNHATCFSGSAPLRLVTAPCFSFFTGVGIVYS